MRNAHKILACIGLSLLAGAADAQDWYEATGKPVQRSSLNSADLRTEFASIDTDIADKLPALTGNGDRVVVVNSAGTSLTVATTGVPVASGGTGATTAADARTNLGLAIGTDVQAYDVQLDSISGLLVTDGIFIVGNGSNFVAESGATARASMGANNASNLDTGTLADARLSANVPLLGQTNTFTEVAASPGTYGVRLDSIAPFWSLDESDGSADNRIWDFGATSERLIARAVADAGGGTTWLGVDRTGTTIDEIELNATTLDFNGAPVFDGITSLQSADVQLRLIETGVTADNGNWLLRANGEAFSIGLWNDAYSSGANALIINRTGTVTDEIELNATLIDVNANADISGSLLLGTALAVAEGGTGSTSASGARTNLGVAIGSDVQSFDADLSAIAGLANTDSNFIVGNGSTWVAESGNTVRTSLGLGSLATASSVNDSSWSGTDLAVANGGTGASDAATARANLGVIGSQFQVASSQESSFSTTMADHPDLSGFTLAANTRYVVEAWIPHFSNSTTPDLRWAWSFTNNPNSSVQTYTQHDGTSAVGGQGTIFASPSVNSIIATTGLHIHATFVSNATTGGTMDFQFAQNTSDAQAIFINYGAWIRVTAAP